MGYPFNVSLLLNDMNQTLPSGQQPIPVNGLEGLVEIVVIVHCNFNKRMTSISNGSTILLKLITMTNVLN